MAEARRRSSAERERPDRPAPRAAGGRGRDAPLSPSLAALAVAAPGLAARGARRRTARRARTSCSSPSTRCAPTAWAPTGTRRPQTPVLDAPGRGAACASSTRRRLDPPDRPLARHDPHRPVPARARRPRQRRVLARRAPSARSPTLLKRRGLPHGGLRGRLPGGGRLRLRPGLRRRSTRTSTRARSPAQGAERPANEVADAAIAWLAANGDAARSSLWVHFYDPHAPYDPPRPTRARSPGRPYDGEIAFTDAQVGRVLDALARRGPRGRHGGGGGGRPRRVARRARRADARGPRLRGRRCACRCSWRARASAGPGRRATRVGTVDVTPTLLGARSASSGPTACPAATCGPALARRAPAAASRSTRRACSAGSTAAGPRCAACPTATGS